MDLETKLVSLNRVGVATGSRLKLIGLQNINDLLFYFPYRYEDYTKSTPIKDLISGIESNFVGEVLLIQNKKSQKKRINITEALIKDQSGQIKIIWFNQPFITKNLKIGDKVSVSGKVESDGFNLVLKSPQYEKISITGGVHTQGLVPIYHLTSNITQKQIRYLIKQIIHHSKDIKEYIPKETIERQVLIELSQALEKIHFPENYDDIDKAKKRIAFEEVLLVQLQSQINKERSKSLKAQGIQFLEEETKKFVESLPFSLTASQKKSAWSILQDIQKESPMTRLLEGDVGSGKTIVAAIPLLNTALNKKFTQSVLMVPTEILALQHFNSITKIFENYNLKIGLISRTNKKVNYATDKKINEKHISENCQIIIGTHSLIQEKVNFKNLGLVIIDEQHRFGVEQRKMLTEKSGDKLSSPHFLSMTATPIPRSLALALYGDLDLSIINEMPKGRKKIITKVVPETKRDKAYSFIKDEITKGRQVFVICPLIDVSDKLGVKSVKEEFKKINEVIFPKIKVEMLHGKMKTKEKEDIMKNFSENKTKIIVSTSVIEVGIDIPNATIMMIEGSDRFGLAQLHQFRGRVGRGDFQSYCFLFTDNKSPKTIKRLKAMEKYSDGLDLSKVDLEFRGPGEIYGTAQKGYPELKVASIFDYQLINSAQKEAIEILEKYPNLENLPEIQNKVYNNTNTHLE